MRGCIAFFAALGLAGCTTRSGVVQAAGDYDMGQACFNQDGGCYEGTYQSLCVQTGPAGCDEDPTAPNALFCCIQFAPDASLYATQGAQQEADGGAEAGGGG